ncbi:efflux RND transporter periplasmic adaptor subunit [Parachryseolinea silvisoli]|uniref:efflux RND transporter periplasmic adaptor subunit n=1 Tax=Parachryseolinea silvisoli TaxID=2873601 RepID=UPI0022658E23|nr:efflux RND transporter periplasmic adaptor subunit [Parachryseolinea silvisoli]MCD9017396.1 efflux RND transporter periplasmic adaptor subunit [Parachryseolinea silvisoli]
MNKKLLIVGGIVTAVVLAAGFFFFRKSSQRGADVIVNVKQGTFRIEIETTGELEAKNSVKILGPTRLRDFNIWNITVQDIIEEGTVLKKGDWVATLDRSEFQKRYGEKQIEVEKASSQYVQQQLDTALTLQQARDELVNLRYDREERQIVLNQSKYEPPATIKQNEIALDKAERAYIQAQENYKIKRRQSVEKMRQMGAEMRKLQNEFSDMMTMMQAFEVIAPEDGMVIYEKGWDGKPIRAGSQINMWEPSVAKLPDLTTMMSKTYVNEVDVRKVKAGQSVEIGLDAYPDKRLKGTVMRVANVGEQRPNSDARVFEVSVEISGTDPALRPAMTTSNRIVAHVLDSVLYIPLECLHSQADTITFVFTRDGMRTIKQEVMIGATNSNDAVVLAGLPRNAPVFLSVPAGMEGESILLLKEMEGKRRRNPGTLDRRQAGVPSEAPSDRQ